MTLDQLEQLAREATPDDWDNDHLFAYYIPNKGNAAYIAAADPTTVLALIRVARAAGEWREVRRSQRMAPEKDLLEAIDALAALERT